MKSDAKRVARRSSLLKRSTRRRLSAALLGALGAVALWSAPSSAAVPTFESSFDGSDITPAPPSQFSPGEIAVDQQTGDIWVIDSTNWVINRFSSTGEFEGQLDGSNTTSGSFLFGGFDGLAIDNSGGPNQGNIYVAQETPTKLFAFRSDGSFIWETTDNLADICGVTVSPVGGLWSSDFINGIQQRIPTTGAAIGARAHEGAGQCAIAWDTQNNLYVNVFAGGVFRSDPPFYDNRVTIDDQQVVALAVDPSTDWLYTVRSDGGIGVYDAEGREVNGSPFAFDRIYSGVAINPITRKLYATASPWGRVDVYSIPEPSRMLRVTVAGTGRGSVTSAPAGIDCGETCEAEFAESSEVTLTATPSNSDVSWTGCEMVDGNECRVTLDADTEVTATFAQHVPTIAGERATGVTDKGATLSGTVNPNGSPTTCEFEYGTTTSYGTTVPCTTDPGSGTSDVTVTIPPLTGLAPNTTYHFRINATNAGGTRNGGDNTFTTAAPPAPSVNTGSASSVTQTGATLSGTVNPNGYATTCYFEYGTTTAYGNRVACASAPGSGTSAVNVSATLTGLTAGTAYHYRLVASSEGGVTTGSDATFSTSPPPSCATDKALCPPPPPPRTCETDASLCPTLSLGASTATVRGGKALLKLVCKGSSGTCTGKVRLVARVKSAKRGKRGKAKTSTVVVGTANVRVAAGAQATVRVSLSRAGRRLLAKQNRLRVAVSGAGLRGQVTLKQARSKRKSKRGKR